MGIKTISGSPAIPAPITAGKIPYANGTNTLTYLPIGSVGQVLRVNSTTNAPEWGYHGKVLLASYSGTADLVLTNIPQFFREIRVVILTTGSPVNMSITSLVLTNGGTSSNSSSASCFWNASATSVQALNASASGTSAEHPVGAVDLASDGGSINIIEIVIPEYSGSTYSGSSLTERVMYSIGLCPPGSSTNAYSMNIVTTKYSVSAANVGISGFTVNLNAISSSVWVYAS